GVTAPLTALFAARVASTAFRNDDQLALLSQAFAAAVPDDNLFFTTLDLELDARVSLSWCLTRRECFDIDTAAGAAGELPVRSLLEWWGKRPENGKPLPPSSTGG